MAPRLFSERLYLAREGIDVFIAEEFAQHVRPFQRDGIRFLYRQYNKKNPGVILNDPPGYGKTVQAVLFVEAMRQILRPLPSLILCDPDKVQHWRYHFHMWTNSAKDILDDGTNIFSKKEVFVTSVHNVADMSRREWGIVVVDSVDSVSFVKQLKLLKAKFKVWLSNDNLLNNIKLLCSIYEWINPKDKLDPNVYSKAGLTLREQIEKEIQLDIFCQDILLRRTNEVIQVNREAQKEIFDIWNNNKAINRKRYFEVTHDTSVNEASSTIQTAVTTDIPKVAEVSRKNKDSTGLKIKRSKPTSGETSNTDEIEQKRSRIFSVNGIDMSDITGGCVIRRPFPEIALVPTLISETAELNQQQSLPEDKPMGSAINTELNANNIEEKMIMEKEAIVQQQSLSVDKPAESAGNVESIVSNLEEKMIIETEVTVHQQPLPKEKPMGRTSNVESIVTNHEEKMVVEKEVTTEQNQNSTLNWGSAKDNENIQQKKKELKTQGHKANDIHSSVKRIEELANKQFKGSLLDNLF